MIALDAASAEAPIDLYSLARRSLSGKRIALVGPSEGAMKEYIRVITDADGFTRFLSPQNVEPSAEVFKPFELILLDIQSAIGTEWMEPKSLVSVRERCIAIGPFPEVLRLVCEPAPEFREYWPSSAPPEEVLLRCVLALRGRADSVPRHFPASSTVVLADDDTSVTAIVRRALERNGMNCEVASTGRDALALITRVKPCAAIVDIHMPTINGFELLSHIKSDAELSQTRVILLTGCEQEADVIRGFTLGADDYVCKPFNPMELTIRLMRVIGRL